MQYFGGKARISKELSHFMNSELKEGQAFYDVFCGSCNVISKIEGTRPRVANDLHEELIELFKYLQLGGELPDSVSEAEYADIKKNGALWLKAFVGFGSSFAGKYFGGYARGDKPNYCATAKRGLLKKMETLYGVLFTNCDYSLLEISHKSAMLYCDIPYKTSVGYSVGAFDHEKFYLWASERQAEGHTVLISEYENNVPAGCEIVWRKESSKSIRNAAGQREGTSEVLFKPLVLQAAGG